LQYFTASPRAPCYGAGVENNKLAALKSRLLEFTGIVVLALLAAYAAST
jgi:hypothetical protein